MNEIEADVIFIKNIDNVVPDRLKPETVEWKQVIAGVLVSLQKQAFEYLTVLDAGANEAQLEEIAKFVSEKLCTDAKGKKADANYLRTKLNRPMRVLEAVRSSLTTRMEPYRCKSSRVARSTLTTRLI